MKKFLTYALIIAGLSVIAGLQFYSAANEPNALACNLAGKVIRVTDGDSITVLDSKKGQHKIRLAGIDAPERKQPYGKVARQFLAKQVFKKQVCVSWYKRDKYKRLVGIVSIDDEDMNLKILSAGLAWHYKQYQKEQSKSDRTRYSEAQEAAEDDDIGLWGDRNPVPPWLWRRGER